MLAALFTGLGYLTGAVTFVLAARRRRVATEGIWLVAAAGLIGGLLGARLTEWLLGGGLAARPEAFFDPRAGGRALLGGVFFGWLAVELTKRRLGIRRSTGDLFALALPAGEAVGRIGCFLTPCCYGVAVSGGWTVHQAGALRHPVQIYSALVATLILAILLAVRERLPREGDLFRLYLLLFGATRFGLEFLRERPVGLAGLSTMQWISLELVLFGGLALLLSASKRDKGACGPAANSDLPVPGSDRTEVGMTVPAWHAPRTPSEGAPE